MIELIEASRRYGDTVAVNAVSLKVPKGSLTAVVGSSGSGKTTLLRMVNRMVEPSGGQILVSGKDNRSLPGHELRRRIGYAIQNHGLFPHRTVAQNIATVPRLLGWDRARVSRRVDELLTLFHLDPSRFRTRFPAELSGGQQQRVGVARALAAEPEVLLMDEPFGALDPVIRKTAQDELRSVQRQTGATVLLVTHDMSEAVRLSDQIAVMENGRLLQHASPEEILARPADSRVDAMVGSTDRAFRLLSLVKVADRVEPGEASGEPISAEADGRDALGALLWTSREAAPVVDAAGHVIGVVRAQTLMRDAAGENR